MKKDTRSKLIGVFRCIVKNQNKIKTNKKTEFSAETTAKC